MSHHQGATEDATRIVSSRVKAHIWTLIHFYTVLFFHVVKLTFDLVVKKKDQTLRSFILIDVCADVVIYSVGLNDSGMLNRGSFFKNIKLPYC